MSSVLKPFAKIVGGAPRAQVPEGYEVVKTGTQTSYITGGGYQSSVQRRNEQQYERLLQEADRAPVSGPFGYGGPRRDQIEREYRRVDDDVYEVLPINRNQQATQPAAPPPASPAAPPAVPPPVAPVAVASPAPPSGGPQPVQPAQPATPATATVPSIRPAAPVSSAPAGVGGPQGGVIPRRGRGVFVTSGPLGLTRQATTQKKQLLGS